MRVINKANIIFTINATENVTSTGSINASVNTAAPPNRTSEPKAKHRMRSGSDFGNGRVDPVNGAIERALSLFNVNKLAGKAANKPTKNDCGRKSMVSSEKLPSVSSDAP